jgi:hypothetical protein
LRLLLEIARGEDNLTAGIPITLLSNSIRQIRQRFLSKAKRKPSLLAQSIAEAAVG